MTSQNQNDLNIAIAAFQKGELDTAERVCINILSRDSCDAGANYILALINGQKGLKNVAINHFREAIFIAPEYFNYRIALSSYYLEINNPESAIKELEIVLSKVPDSIAAHTNIGTAFKKKGNLEKALAHFDKAAFLFRKPQDKDFINNNRQNEVHPTFSMTRETKLEHDIQQLEFLQSRYPSNVIFSQYANKMLDVLASFRRRNINNGLGSFSELEYEKIYDFYNKILFRPILHDESPILGDHKVNTLLSERFDYKADDIVIIDDFLCEVSLVNVQRYCLESTVWFDTKNDSGYLGAYMHDGFIPSFTLAIQPALREKWEKLFLGKVLKQLWAFKYVSEGEGTRFHADDASINVNLWITPDNCCFDPENSGLTLFPINIPENIAFSYYNNDKNRLNDLIKGREREKLIIPYKCNRAVIFKSRFIHKTSGCKFIPGYENRRINITLLFD